VSGADGTAVAVVAGGAGTLGSAVARRLVDDGYIVAVLDRRVPPSEPGVVAFEVDLVDDARVAEAAGAVAELGPIEILVNAQGYSPKDGDGRAPAIEETSAEDFLEVLRINLVSCFLTMRELVPPMAERGRGWVVNVGSAAARTARTPAAPSYLAAKSGLEALTRTFGYRYAAAGVVVSCVAPGKFESPGWRDDPESQARYLAELPVGRLLSVDELVDAVAFLCSASNRYFTARTLVLDGGRLA
jgi:3-oxoacyl-[acyl-carrier protein] reductase